jgi:hypothetical protein
VRRLPALAALAALLLAASGCGTGGPGAIPRRPPSLALRTEALPRAGTALAGGAAVVVGGRMLLLGGLDPADLSTAGIWAFTPGKPLRRVGRLPFVTHDHAAVATGDTVWLIGGGDAYGSLVLRARPFAIRTVGQLPVGLRYPAVAVGTLPDGRPTLFVAGGETAGGLSRAVYAVAPSGAVRRVGTLPFGIAQAGAFFAAGRLFVVGGETAAGLSRAVLELTAGGRTRRVARLPRPYADGFLFREGRRVYLVDGLGPEGRASDAVEEIRLLGAS